VLSPSFQGDPWDKVMEYGREVSETVDVSVFQRLPVVVRSRVLAEGKVPWCRDQDALYEVARATAHQLEDVYPRYKAYLEEAGRGRP
jgi:hypothetical protein